MLMFSVLRCGLVLAVAALSMAVCGPALADTTVTAQLHEINDSGVHGTATLTAHDDGSLTVVIHGTGYVPGPAARPAHPRVVGGRALHVPDDEERHDGDGVLTNEEASGEYGTDLPGADHRG